MSDAQQGNVLGIEGVAQIPPPATGSALPPAGSAAEKPSRDKLLDIYHAIFVSAGASQRIVADEAAAMALELDAFARTTLSATGDSMTALLRAKNLADAVDIQQSLARRNLEAIAAGTARLGELGLRLLVSANNPFLDAAE